MITSMYLSRLSFELSRLSMLWTTTKHMSIPCDIFFGENVYPFHFTRFSSISSLRLCPLYHLSLYWCLIFNYNLLIIAILKTLLFVCLTTVQIFLVDHYMLGPLLKVWSITQLQFMQHISFLGGLAIVDISSLSPSTLKSLIIGTEHPS